MNLLNWLPQDIKSTLSFVSVKTHYKERADVPWDGSMTNNKFYGTGIKQFAMLKIMRVLWGIGYNLYNWCEDRRPGGGFHKGNLY